MRSGREHDLPDLCPVGFLVDAVLGGIAVRADGHVQRRSVGTRDDVLGPVVVDGAGRQIEDSRPDRNVDRVSATPSPSASRSKVSTSRTGATAFTMTYRRAGRRGAPRVVCGRSVAAVQTPGGRGCPIRCNSNAVATRKLAATRLREALTAARPQTTCNSAYPRRLQPEYHRARCHP
jgi:hypothetical protein